MLLLQPAMSQDKDLTGKTAAHYCAENPTTSCIEQILANCPDLLNEKDDEGYTPLLLAVISGNVTIVDHLLTKGADFNAVDNELHSVVHWATGKNNYYYYYRTLAPFGKKWCIRLVDTYVLRSRLYYSF